MNISAFFVYVISFVNIVNNDSVQSHTSTEKKYATQKGIGQTPLVLTSNKTSCAELRSTEYCAATFESTSFSRSTTHCSDPTRDGDIWNTMEMQILRAYGQPYSRILWRMLGSLDIVQRPDLCPQVQSQEGQAVRPGLYQHLDRHTMGRRGRDMESWSQITEKEDAVTETKKQEYQSPNQDSRRRRTSGSCRRQRTRERKRCKRWSCGLWTLAAIYGMDGTTNSTLSVRTIDLTGNDIHGLAAIWQGTQRQGRSRVDCSSSSTCPSSRSIWRTIRRSQESPGSDRIQHTERRCQELQAADIPFDTSSQTSCGHRRVVGCLQNAVDELPRHGYEDVDGTHRLLRGRRDKVFTKKEGSCHSPATGENTTSRDTCSNDVSRGHSTFRRAARRSNSTGCHHDHFGHGYGRGAAPVQAVEDGSARSCSKSARDHRREACQKAQNLRERCRRRCADHGRTRFPSAGIQSALTLHASCEEAKPMEFLIDDAWRGEGRSLRRTKLRRLAFWPTVSTHHHQGQQGHEICHLFSESDAGVEKYLQTNREAFNDWDVPPLHSVQEEPDFVSLWEAQTRALLLTSSLHLPGLATHFDAVFFEPFIKDARYPVPEEDLIELGIRRADEHKQKTTDEVMQSSVLPLQTLCDASSKGPVQQRPDSNAPQNLPDPPDREEDQSDERERDRDHRVPLHRYPYWTTELWNILQTDGAVEMEEEGPIMYLNSFYISHHNCPRQTALRPVRLTQQYAQWEEEILEVWQDHVDREAGYDIFVVQPEPPRPVTRGTVGTILLVQHPDPHRVAIVTTVISDALVEPWQEEVAHSIATLTDYNQILLCARVRHQCLEAHRQGSGHCTLHIGNRQLHRDRPIRLHDGMGLVINIPMVINEELWQNLVRPRFQAAGLVPENIEHGPQHHENDFTNFMARRPQPKAAFSSPSSPTSTSRTSSRSRTSSEVEWKRTVIFSLDGRAHSALLPWQDGDELHDRVATAFDIEVTEIQQLHFVSFRPVDLQRQDLQCLLLQRQNEARPTTFMRLILVDIEILEQNDVLPGAFRRQALWMPQTVTRQTVFRLLGMESHCQQQSGRCHLWFNNVLTRVDRSAPLQLDDGDYLEVYVGDNDRGRLCLPHSDSDDVNLLQEPLPKSRRVSEHHKTSHTVLDSCFSRRGGPPHRRLRRRQEEEEDPELQALRALWGRQHRQSRGINNEPIMIFNTWFLSALNFPRCSTDRQVALPGEVTMWDQLLRQVWRDRQHPHWPLKIIPVDPDPTGTRNGGHLIILQHEHPEEAAVLMSNYRGVQQDRFAQLIPMRLTFDRFLWFQDQEHLCPLPEIDCRGYHGTVEIPQTRPWEGAHGQHLELFVQSAESELTSFMQHNQEASTSSNNIGAAQSADNNSTGGPCASFQFNANAASFNPTQATIYAQEEEIQEIHEVWQMAAFAWEDEEKSATFAVWFVDHGWNWPHGRIYRKVQLYEDFTTWKDTIINTWFDHLQPGAPIEIVYVTPPPPTRDNSIAGHVVVIQNANANWVTSLITIQPDTLQMAVTTHEHILLDNILLVLELYGDCVGHMGRVPPLQCRAWYIDQELHIARPYPGRRWLMVSGHRQSTTFHQSVGKTMKTGDALTK